MSTTLGETVSSELSSIDALAELNDSVMSQFMVNDAWVSGFVTLKDGTQLHYWQYGTHNKKALLFLNVFLAAGDQDGAAFLNVLSTDFNCLTIDMRGCGRSRDVKRTFQMDFYHQDASDAAEVMSKLGYEKYSVLGSSDGGIAAIILAATHSLSVENLILFGTQVCLTESNMEIYDVMRDLDTWNPMVIQSRLEYHSKKEMEELTHAYYEALVEIKEKRNGDLCIEEAKKLRCPTLILHGEGDLLHDLENVHFLKGIIRNSTLRIFPNDDHLLLVIKLHEVKQLLVDFINKN